MELRSGFIRGTGSAINVSLGWIPDFVLLSNATDGDKIHAAWLGGGHRVMPFTSGGTTQIRAGQSIKGATSNATAKVTGVILDSGSWAGGDAAGWLLIDLATKVGTFQSENVYITSDSTSGTDDATVTVDVDHTEDIDTEVADATGNNAITGYKGSADDNLAPGFTVGSTVSEDAKLLRFFAVRGINGANPFIANSL